MNDETDFDQDLRKIVDFCKTNEKIRAAILTSTRAVPGAKADLLSDYDVILVMTDINAFVTDHRWLEAFGHVAVAYWDSVHEDTDFGIEKCANVVQFDSGLKIDFTLWQVDMLKAVVQSPHLIDELDAGYRILIDKDNVAGGLSAASYRAYIPKRPSQQKFLKQVNDFLSDVPYVAKCLWRNELMPLKWCLDYDMKHVYLREMLEWRFGIETDWSKPTGALGKGLKDKLPQAIWKKVETTYAGIGVEENWKALARTVELYRSVAIEVGESLGYRYPEVTHRAVVEYMERIMKLPPR